MTKRPVLFCVIVLLACSSAFATKALAISIVKITGDSLFMSASAGIETDPPLHELSTYCGPSMSASETGIGIQSGVSFDPDPDRNFLEYIKVYTTARVRWSDNSILLGSISDDWLGVENSMQFNPVSDADIFLMLTFTVCGDDTTVSLGGTGVRGNATFSSGHDMYLRDLAAGTLTGESITSGSLDLLGSHSYDLFFHLWNKGIMNDAGGDVAAGIRFGSAEIDYDVPEPSTVLLIGPGLVLLLVFGKVSLPRGQLLRLDAGNAPLKSAEEGV